MFNAQVRINGDTIDELDETFTVQVTGDTTAESNEAFTVVLANPTNAIIVRATGTATMVNDD